MSDWQEQVLNARDAQIALEDAADAETRTAESVLERLERLAGAATPGPWQTREAVQGGRDTIGDIAITAEAWPSGPGFLPVIGEVWAERHEGYPDNAQTRADAAYIAAASPDVVSALVALARKVERYIAEARAGRPYGYLTSGEQELYSALQALQVAPEREVSG